MICGREPLASAGSGDHHTSRWPRESMSPRYRVRVADENDVETWTAYLSDLDCDTKLAASADVLTCVADWRPDLVLLDANMPAGGGFDVCRQIKRHAGPPKTMVLMVTQLNELDEIERAVEAGTDDFLSKPVNEAEFLKRVDNLLKLSRL